jgi:hypothetical protein
MNHKTKAAKAAGISAAQKESAPTETSKGEPRKFLHFIARLVFCNIVFYSLVMVAVSIANWLHKVGAV